MIEIVIIGQNEGASIEKMLASLSSYPYQRTWVLDRCTDNSEKILVSLGEQYVKTCDTLKGRQTSRARNTGLSFTNSLSDVLFLDGDRYVSSGSLTGLETSENDIELLLLEEDPRNEILSRYNYARDFYGHVYNYFFSCGVFLKRTAIDRILDFQPPAELFSVAMQKAHGSEDCYLGDVCYHLGLTADLYNGCRLHGRFDTLYADFEQFKIRLQEREKLNVRWKPTVFLN